MTQALPLNPVYNRWDSYYAVLVKRVGLDLENLPSTVTGNDDIVTSDHPATIVPNVLHHAFRKLIKQNGALYHPENDRMRIAILHKRLNQNKKNHTDSVRILLDMFEDLHGPGSAQSTKIFMDFDNEDDEDEDKDNKKKVIFKNLTELRKAIRKHPDLTPDQLSKLKKQNKILSGIDQYTIYNLQAFKAELRKNAAITLGHNKDDSLVIDNTTNIYNEISPAYRLYLYKEGGDHIVNTLRIPQSLSEEIQVTVKTGESTYRAFMENFKRMNLKQEPMVADVFVKTENWLRENIAHYVSYPKLMHYISEDHRQFIGDMLIKPLGLDDEATHQQAQQACRERHMKMGHKPIRKPVIFTGNKCPFGHG